MKRITAIALFTIAGFVTAGSALAQNRAVRADVPFDFTVGDKLLPLFNVADYDKRMQGYRELNRFAVESGATIPLLQSVLTLVRKNNLAYTKYANGWVLPQSMHWS